MADISLAGVGGVKSVTLQGKLGAVYAAGMALTLTGPKEVGLGAAGGSPAFGVVTKVEIDKRDDAGVAADIVLGVQTAGFSERVKMTSAAANRPAVGSYTYCNNNGELVKTPDTPAGAPCGVVVATDTTENTATVRWF